MSQRIHNFSAGPAALPEPVLRKAQEAIWDVADSGIGIMEHSHRGKVFDRIIVEAEEACRNPRCTFEQLSPLGLRGLYERGLEELPDDAEGELALHLGRP